MTEILQFTAEGAYRGGYPVYAGEIDIRQVEDPHWASFGFVTPNRNSASLQFCVGTVIIVTKVGEQHLPWQYCKIMTADVFIWWFFLCAVSGLNILAWALSAQALERRQAALPEAVYRARRLQLFLSAGYVFGCAFRSILPVYDVPRVCLFD